jgi:hypothetical protein
MGCDIHCRAERCVNGKWEVIPKLYPFDWRQYGMYGFLANVRNYSDVPPISEPRGLPPDCTSNDEDDSRWLGDHSYSWLSLAELLAFNYDAEVEDRRVTVKMPGGWINGGATAEPGGGTPTTFRAFLGDPFFEELEKLKAAGAERIVFGFDS